MPSALDQEIHPASLARRSNSEWRELHDTVLTPNYGPRRLAFVRGQGTRVWDAEGREFLDFLTGISVNNLGHCHPRVTKAIQEQAATLVHCSNLYYIPVQIELARLLTRESFAERVFFGNSGAEANEAAIKIARRWSFENCGGNENRVEVITMEQSFHGRTFATLAATGQDKVKKHFFPLAQGFKYARLNDLDSVTARLTENTCAIMVEPVQGEGGIQPATKEFLAALRKLCTERRMLLIFDEVQSGLGRIGTLFAYQHFGIEPDVMTLAKSLGGGLAMGAMLTRKDVAEAFGIGAHASTMGGNALTSAAALAYLSELVEGEWPAKAAESGAYFRQKLESGLAGCEGVTGMRVLGLMIGIDVRSGGAEIVQACEDDGLLINLTAGSTLRLLPPLNVSRDEMDHAAAILTRAIRAHAR